MQKNIERQISPDYIKAYTSNENGTGKINKQNNNFTFLKTYYGFIVLFVLCLSIMLSFLVSIKFLLLYFPSLSCFYFIRENIATIRNIKVLKRMNLYELAQKEKPVSYYKGFSFSKNFLYSGSLVIPIFAIKEVVVGYRRKRGYVLELTLKSDEIFIISIGRMGATDLKEKLLLLNPTIVTY